jgi:SpoVK/Ycf46/Vps4 family AAA+-type ATPase
MKNHPSRGQQGHRAPAVNTIPKAYRPILRLWVLRLIHLGGGLSGDRSDRQDLSSAGREAAGLPRLWHRFHEPDPAQVAEAEATFRSLLQAAEEAPPVLPGHTALAQNVDLLGEAVGLNATERRILHFVILAFHHPGLENALNQLGGLSLGGLQGLFVRVLGLSPSAVAKALDPGGALTRAGLMWVDTNANFPFRGKVEILNGLCDRMSIRHRDAWGLFRTAFVKAPKPTLSLTHYPHVSKDLEILVPYLKESLRNRRKGVNILIHGGPGTGKTELVRTLSTALGAQLYEVSAEDPRGWPVEGNDRFRGYRLAQAVLSRREEHLILFDEIEDFFRPREDAPRTSRNNVTGLKGWVNKVLEENQVPAFWVTNHLFILDEAFIRRFDYVIRLDNPPRSVRRRMLEENLRGLPVEGHRKDLLAMHEGLSPALINRVAGVARTIHPVLGQKDAGPVLSQLLGNALEALGHTRNPRQVVEVVTDYRPELLNTDCDLSPVLGGLREFGNGRICFYGPPGTGKTAYGHHLAKELDRPLLLKRASDLLNKYVGGTEKLLAAMFEEARAEGAVLLLDEADSFLQERGKAQQSWQVTQVNEMLTQMESFDGIFIASTNLMDQLDAAALRRFDLKVRFDYLRPEQAWIMFQDAARRLGIESDVAMKGCLSSLSILTPGDFATVLRQARMNRPRDSRDLLCRLEAECQVKPDHRRKPIGFSERVT